MEEMVGAAEEMVEKETMGLCERMKNPIPTLLTIKTLLEAFPCHPKVLNDPQFLE